MSHTQPVLAADIGGSLLKLGVVCQGQVLAQDTIEAHADRPLADRLPVMLQAWRVLCGQLQTTPEKCMGIGISFPSVMHPQTGRVVTHFGKYADAPSLDLKAWAKQTLNLPLGIENDARTALLGEWQHGAGKNIDHLVMVTLGTGLGSAAICDGRPLRGGHGQAAIMAGHSTIAWQSDICPICGNIGCAEQEASTAALPRLLAHLPGLEKSQLAKESVRDYAAIFKLAREGDAYAVLVRDYSLKVWGVHAANFVLAFDPERIIVGGGIAQSPEVVDAIRDHIYHYALTPWGKVEVVRSQLGNSAALLGCEWLGRNAF